MKKTAQRFRRVLSAIVCSAIMCGVLGTIQFQTTASTLSDAQNQLAILESQYETAKGKRQDATSAYQSALAEYNASKADYENALALKQALDAEISDMEAEIDATYALIDEYNTLIADLKVQIAEKEAEIDQKYANFKERVRINYEDSFVSYLEMVFTADSFSDLLSRVDIVSSLMDYDAKVIDELDAAKTEMAQMQSQTETLQKEASIKLAQLEEQLPTLEEKKAKSLEVLADLQSLYAKASEAYNEASGEKKAADANLADLAAKIAEAEETIAREIAAQQQSNDQEYQGTGSMGWPVDAAYRKISSPFGYRTDPFGSGATTFHNGIDMPCPYGANIYAAESGRVITATFHWSYGNYVVIDHGGGISTLYAHNSALCVSVGQTVTRGQVIAKAGGTGSVTAVHCHFCVIQNGKHVNPLGFLS